MLSESTVRPVNNRQLFIGAICKLLGRSGYVINAIAATFMNSSADSVDLLPKLHSTIAAKLFEVLPAVKSAPFTYIYKLYSQKVSTFYKLRVCVYI